MYETFASELFLFNVEVNLSRTYSFQEATFSVHMQWSPAVSLQRKAITVYASVQVTTVALRLKFLFRI